MAAAKKDVNQILNKIQVILNAPKSQTNNYGGYKYRNLEDILEALKPHLESTGCFLTLEDEVVLVGNRYYTKATATISYDGKSVTKSAFAREAESQKGMNEAQLSGSTSSYARKYALNGLFCIDDSKHRPNIEIDSEEFDKIGEKTATRRSPKKAAASPKHTPTNTASAAGPVLIPCGALKDMAYSDAITSSGVCQQHIEHWHKTAKTEIELQHLGQLRKHMLTFAKGVA